MTKLTLKQAVEQNCFDCCYDPLDVGTKHQQTENCTITSCKLWEFRPVTNATKQVRKQEKLDAMTPEERLKEEQKRKEAADRLKAVRTAISS